MKKYFFMKNAPGKVWFHMYPLDEMSTRKILGEEEMMGMKAERRAFMASGVRVCGCHGSRVHGTVSWLKVKTLSHS